MPCGQMNFGKCYRKIGRIAYLNQQDKPNVTKDYGSGDAMSRAVRRRVGRFASIGSSKKYGPLFGLKKNLFDNSCSRFNNTRQFYYKSNSGSSSDVIYWKRNYGGSINLMNSGKNCQVVPCNSKFD